MNHTSLSADDHDAITDAAAQWCLRLQAGDCTAAEHQAFGQWLAANPLHAQEYQAMLEIWHTADHLSRPAVASNVITHSERRRSTWRHYALATAIALAALPAGAWIGWEQGWLPNSYQHLESTNTITHAVLEDGSEVELNLASELRYSNYKGERRVTLIKGEAFFKVRHDSQHPFIVHAANGQTRVTGTQFNVWKYEDRVKVTLVEGSVLVDSNSQDTEGGYRLVPGMQASYQAGDYEPHLSQTYAQDTSLSWRNGKLILDNLSLEQALPQINRYLEKPLLLADESIGNIRISGVYDTAQINRLVGNLPKVLPVYLTRNKQGNMVLNRISPPPSRG
ncbi:peptide ABC transporter substrate-binding protein [Pseudomonas sp. MYb187]|uniref:FecR family protein n=1 Tax=Pseudomonas TaxID=286 RepID=UPI000CFBB6EC|nr:FecR family protein [Pseudomonas sp. MYb187]PRA62528.1 peptide ABC transporter substrate-binding protein [Pseudomonas sp. MYb187]